MNVCEKNKKIRKNPETRPLNNKNPETFKNNPINPTGNPRK